MKLLSAPCLCLGAVLLAGGAAAAPADPAPAAGAAPAAAPDAEAPGTRLRPLSGSVGLVDRAGQPLALYLDRLEATLFLEQAHGTVGPYVVSVTNSLEALPPPELAGRGERLLLDSYLVLANLIGPQAGRLAVVYTSGLGQLLGLRAEETSVSPGILEELRQIGAYAVTAAAARARRLPPAEQAAALTQLRLAEGKYVEAARHAKEWERLSPSVISRGHRLGAQVLSGGAPAARELAALEREGGAAAVLAGQLLRRAARESLVTRLGKSLGGAALPPEVRQAASAWVVPTGRKGGAPAEPPLREACLRLLKDAGTPSAAGPRAAATADCQVLLLEGPGSAWAEVTPAGTSRRANLLGLARALGSLLGLPGRKPLAEAAEREAALADVLRLLPSAELAEDDRGAVALLARLSAAGVSSGDLPPAIAQEAQAYLSQHGCSPLSVTFHLGQAPSEPRARARALGQVISRCAAPPATPRADETLRLLALAQLTADPNATEGLATLERLALARKSSPGQGRFLLAYAQGQTMRLLQKGAPDAAALETLAGQFTVASAALTPWDGAEIKGFAEAQLATLRSRQHQLGRQPGLLVQLGAHLRFARLLTPPAESARIESLEVYAAREAQLGAGVPVVAPQIEVNSLPEGLGRRLLACELLRTARARHDTAAAARLVPLAGQGELPARLNGGVPRLLTSLSVDERLRVTTRGEPTTVILPRCVAGPATALPPGPPSPARPAAAVPPGAAVRPR